MDWIKYIYLLVGTWILYHLLLCIYNIFCHPLRQYPGPLLGSATQLLNVYQFLKGTDCRYRCHLHEKYGDVVRTGPNELSFVTASAVKTIFGGNPQPGEIFQKNEIAFSQETGESNNIVFAKGEKHARFRKIIAPAFSESAIRAQEPMIQEYCHHMIQGLRSRSGIGYYPDQDGIVDMVPWTKFIISDILSHMMFGDGLYCVKNAQFHPWIASGYKALIVSTYIEAASRLWPYHKIFEHFFISADMRNGFQTHSSITQLKLGERNKSEEQFKADFTSLVSKSMSEQELFDNVNVVTSAAGETTASTLSATLYYLTQCPDAYKNVVTEVRGAFEKEEDINGASSASLRYLKAVIRESLRIHPPIPVGYHRVTPTMGKFIDGMWVPGGTWVAVSNLAACRRSSNWKTPERFIPERWLGAPGFELDNRESSSPFSIGMSNCVGMSHVNTQMRIILSRLLWNFDFEAQPGNIDPHNFLEYGAWKVEPLMLRVIDFRQE